MTIFLCGPDEILSDECWNCTGWLGPIKKELGEPLNDHNGFGRYCSVECADEASERNDTGKTCTTCGGQEGHCRYNAKDDPPGDPHPFWPHGGDAPPELDAWLERNRTLWENDRSPAVLPSKEH